MSATQELIAAALTAVDELHDINRVVPIHDRIENQLREACARAMVQPAAPDMAEKCDECKVVTARLDGDKNAKWCCHCGAKLTGNYVGALVEARRPVGEFCTDYHCPGDCGLEGAGYQHARQPISEVDAVDGIPVPTGHAEADRLIGRLMSSDPDYDDCADAAALIQREIKGPDGFDTWREAALAERIKRTQQPVGAAEVPMPAPVGWIGWIRHDEGGGRHPMFSTYEPTAYEHRDQVAAMPDVRTYGDAREAAGYARGLAAGGKDAERYRWLRDKSPPTRMAQIEDLPLFKGDFDSAIDYEINAALLDCGDAGHDEGRCGNASCGRSAQAGLVSKVIEHRLRTWRQSRMNKSGDRLSLDDFMGPDSIDDLVDCVCDEFAIDAALLGEVK